MMHTLSSSWVRVAVPSSFVDASLLDLLRASWPQRQRQLLVLAGAADWCRAQACALCATVGDDGLWLGSDAPVGVARLSMQRPDALLGGEWRLMVLDAHDGLRPDTLAAAGGALRGGGRLLLLAPPLAQWSTFRDADYRRAEPFGCATTSARFWQRLRTLLDAPGVLSIEQGQPPPPFTTGEIVDAEADDDSDRFHEQQQAVAEIVRTARGRARRPLVLIADRGRGKSAALGLAAAQLLLDESGLDIVVTSARREACDSLFRFAGSATERLRWLPPVEAIDAGAALLLIDEAAALPVVLLQQLLMSAQRVVFATTVHGYEGSGRGFELRFLPWLQSAAPRWRHCHLRQPLRWQRGDWLEAWLYRALLLDAAPLPPEGSDPRASSSAILSIDALHIQELVRDQLVRDEPLLRQLFGLLVQAHYRTAPDDLRDLLDGPNLRLWLARQGESVVGVLLVAAEGPLPVVFHAAIGRGERRPRGHLLPQALAFHAGLAEALTQRCARVVRIAVAPELQRRGVGQRLLRQAREQLAGEGFDWFGTSFAATAEGLAFWRSAGLQLLRVGFERETSSGLRAAQLGVGLTTAGTVLIEKARQWWCALQPLALADYLHDLDADQVCALLAFDEDSNLGPDAAQRQAIDSYCDGTRPLEAVLPALRQWSHALLARGVVTNAIDRALLVGRLHQSRDWPTLVRQLQLPGVEAAQRRLRQALALLREKTSV